MPYLICHRCDHYFEIDTPEEFDEFNTCECGTELIYVDDLGEYIKFGKTNNTRDSITIGTSYTEKMANISENNSSTEDVAVQKTETNSIVYYFVGIIGILMGVFLLNMFFIIAIFVLAAGLLSLIIGLISTNTTPNTNLIPKKELKSSWAKGLEGEKIVLNHLNTLPTDYYVFHDVTLPQRYGNIDHVVIGPNGIFVIETKNYSGYYLIRGDRWFYYKNGKYKALKKNPGTQLIKNTLELKKYLKSEGIPHNLWVESIVAFVNNNFTVDGKTPKYSVLLPQSIPNYILNKEKNIQEDVFKKAALALEPHCIELTFKRKN